MESHQFKVIIQGSSISPQDWMRAMRASASELPTLTEEQKNVARGFKISKEDYARGELARVYGQERMSERGQKLGELANEILETLGPGFRLLGVTSQMTKLRWVLTIETPSGEANVFVSRELADDVLEWRPREKVEEFRTRLLHGLGLEEAAGRPRQ